MMRRIKKTVSPGDFLRNSLGNYAFGEFKNVPGIEGHLQTQGDFGCDEIAGWFLGTKGENIGVFTELIAAAVQDIAYGRRSFHPEDPGYVTEEVKNSPGYRNAIQSLKDNLYRMLTFLNDYSVPFWSMRYQGHMNWDVTLPSLLGYFTAMLQNQNNVSIQGSPATTFLEMLAGIDICSMLGLGYDEDEKGKGIQPWGHITCDGSVANLEALWSARELRFLPVGIRAALDKEEEYQQVKEKMNNIQVMFGGKEVAWGTLAKDAWKLLNLSNDEILKIPASIAEVLKKNNPDYKANTLPEIEAEVWNCLSNNYSVNALGLVHYYKDPNFLGQENIGMPVVIVPSSKHYSWPKAASILGMGHGKKDHGGNEENGLINVWVDKDARMDTADLNSALEQCRKNKRPVLLTVAVMGSTEESAVDPLKNIIALRNQYRNSNDPFDFNVHADAAWGGYLISIIRKDFDIKKPGEQGSMFNLPPFIDEEEKKKVPLSKHVIEQLEQLRFCDSITVDPHKWGYVPYPAGSLCYRNGGMINLVTFGAPYIESNAESQALSMGESGVEGSKPGAAAAAVFLSHSVIRPSVKGYGKLMKRAVFNSRLYYVYMALMDGKEDNFLVVPFNDPGNANLEKIIKMIHDRPIKDIIDDPELIKLLKEIGPDMNFVDYVINFFIETKDGKVLNTDPQMLLKLHDKLFEKVYIKPKSKAYDYGVMISKTTFFREDYGPTFMDDLANRLKLANPDNVNAIPCMRSVVMDPWLIETETGDDRLNFFKDVFIPELCWAIAESVKETKQEAKQLIDNVTDVTVSRDERKKVLHITADGTISSNPKWCEPELVLIEKTGRGRITFEFRVYPLEIAKKEPFHASYELEDCGDIREIMVIARENNKIELVPQA